MLGGARYEMWPQLPNAQHFPFKAKCQRMSFLASDLHSLMGRLDGALAGTVGVALWMSVYSKDAVDDRVVGKELNLILLDLGGLLLMKEDTFCHGDHAR